VADLIAHCFYHVDSDTRTAEALEIKYALHLIGAKEIHAHSLNARAIELLLPGYPKTLKEQDENETARKFGVAMDRLLNADPKIGQHAMEQEKKERSAR